MCGIAGWWAVDGAPLALERVQAATHRMRHRGPDDEGYLLVDTRSGRHVHAAGPDTVPAVPATPLADVAGEAFDLALGFRRLAIVDPSPAGHQPMAAADGSVWIAFNGEVYNYRELRAELAGRGHRFRSDGDTEVILAAYLEWGAACLDRFNGMWGIAIWDGRSRELFLARDRFGVKPLHYCWDGRRFAFASEIKVLVGGHGVPFAPREDLLYAFLESGRLPSAQAGETFFAGVSSLPPGHRLTVSARGVELARWYRLPDGGAAPLDARAAVTRYRELLVDAVRLRLRADVPVGSCLSGGLDSSAIVCVVDRLMREGGVPREQLGDRQRTFSAVYREQGRFNERTHMETVLGAVGARGYFTEPTAERLAVDFPALAWHQEEPFGSTSIFAQWCVMAAAREAGVTVLLDGQGADEPIGGYRPFDILLAGHLGAGRLGAAVADARAIAATADVSAGPLLARALARRLPRGPVRALGRALRRRRSDAALRPEFAAAHAAVERPSPVYRTLDEYARGMIEEESLPALLRYEDRNSMAFHVEGRVPFLDVRLMEFAITAAQPWAIREGWTKWVLREAVRDLVPESIAWRRDKVGFETPERPWVEAVLARRGGGLAPDAPVARYLDVAEAQRELAGWRAGQGDTRRVWRWLSVDLWLEAFAAAGADRPAAPVLSAAR